MSLIEVSIIIPFYNRTDFLIETLQSLQRQTYKNYEVLIIDDGSKEKEVSLLLKYLENTKDSRFRYLPKPIEVPKGANGSRNYGFKKAKGEYIKWFDSDDLMMPDFIELQVKALKKFHLHGVFASCGVYNEDFTKLIRKKWRKKVFSNNPVKDYLKTQLGWQTGSGLWRKNCFEKIDPFSEDIKNAQEWIFHFYILTENLKIGVIDSELFKMRSHDKSISATKSKDYFNNKSRARVIAFNRLVATRNPGKRYLLKYFYNEYGKKRILIGDLFRLFSENFNLSFQKTSKAELVYISISDLSTK